MRCLGNPALPSLLGYGLVPLRPPLAPSPPLIFPETWCKGCEAKVCGVLLYWGKHKTNESPKAAKYKREFLRQRGNLTA